MKNLSTPGLVLSGLYVLLCIWLITTQGLFGESFISLILGLPWSMIPSFFEFGGASGALIYIFIFAPMILNALILYGIGALLGRLGKKS